jgi:hypothetical protein
MISSANRAGSGKEPQSSKNRGDTAHSAQINTGHMNHTARMARISSLSGINLIFYTANSSISDIPHFLSRDGIPRQLSLQALSFNTPAYARANAHRYRLTASRPIHCMSPPLSRGFLQPKTEVPLRASFAGFYHVYQARLIIRVLIIKKG